MLRLIALPKLNAVAKSLNNKDRIILFDGDKHDRALLGLALRSALPNSDVLEASSAVEVAHHISAGPVDAIVADPVARFGEVISITLDIRKRYPSCLCWLFSGEGSLPSLKDCVGRGIDGRFAKTSSGFLELPKSLLQRLQWFTELKERIPVDNGTLFSSIFPGATCLISDDGSLLMVSEEFERLVEQPRFGLVGQPFVQFWIDSEKRDEWTNRMARPPRTWDFVGRFQCSRSDKPVMAVTLRMLGSEPSGRKLWAGSMTDVSSLATAIVPAKELPEPSSADLEQIAFALSHDLQAPLNSLASHAETLTTELESESEEVRNAVEEVNGLTKRMQQMLDGILDYSILSSLDGKRDIVSLDSMLEEAIGNLRSSIDESGATIEHQPLPALAIVRPQMTQVFFNIISNAIKFRGARVPRIRISSIETGEHLRLRFEDNGIGIDATEYDKIFDMFHRASNDAKYSGIGAGLAICRRIVRAHGGDISVESTPGRGSCFTLEFRGATVRTIKSGDNAREASGL
jgi:signal transduction histidine kinase